MYEDLITFIIYMFSFSVTFFVIKYNWDRRWLYYHASKFKGHGSLTSWPFIGEALHFLGTIEVATNKCFEQVVNCPPVFKKWMGPWLFVVNSQPEDIEILLNKFLEKPEIMKFTGDVMGDGILILPYDQWKKHRRIISLSFNLQIVKSFLDIFIKYSNHLVDDLKQEPQDNLVDIFQKIWERTIDMSCEAVFDIDVNLIDNKHDYMSSVIRGLELTLLRVFEKPWLALDIFWKMSSHYKEFQLCVSKIQGFRNKIWQIKKSQQTGKAYTVSLFDYYQKQLKNGIDMIKEKRFLNNLLNKDTKMTEKEVLEEITSMLFGSSETSATTASFVLLVLAILQDVQIKVYEELYSIFKESNRDVTYEDLKKMNYLERVIKETMRLFPPVLVLGRFVHKDFELNNHFYPKGSYILVSPYVMNRSSRLWKDPLVFNPDRFISEEVKKMHRCAFIPFSYGARNCLGNLYGMLSVKIILSTLLRNYKVISCNYQSLEDIKMVCYIITKTNKGFKIALAKRN